MEMVSAGALLHALSMAVETIGERLRKARDRAGVKQVTAAEAVGIRPHTLWRWEAGQIKSPNLDVIVALVKLYDADLEWVLTGRGAEGEWRLPAMHELEESGRLARYIEDGLSIAEIRSIDRTLSHHGGGATQGEVEAALAQLVAINRGRALRSAEPDASRDARGAVIESGGPKLKGVLK